jgi:hypothetical protein
MSYPGCPPTPTPTPDTEAAAASEGLAPVLDPKQKPLKRLKGRPKKRPARAETPSKKPAMAIETTAPKSSPGATKKKALGSKRKSEASNLKNAVYSKAYRVQEKLLKQQGLDRPAVLEGARTAGKQAARAHEALEAA